MKKEDKLKLKEYFEGFITDKRKDLFEKVSSDRTRHIAVVLENIYQSQNASAVVRSCDCHGIQDLYVIENNNKYEVNPDVALGSSKWVDLHRFSRDENNTLRCINHLKEKGYKILATSPHENDINIHEMPLDQKTAIVFGNELDGISDIVKDNADGFVKIPMYGFTESFNISVSAAICLSSIITRLHSSDVDFKLDEDQKLDLQITWLKKMLRNADEHERKFIEKLLNETS